MKQFKLSFTQENLQRHLNYNPRRVYTIRDEMKGRCGDLTIIDSEIYSVNKVYPTTLAEIKNPKNHLWKKEGFSSQEEYINEIQGIYGSNPDKQLYLMVLVWVPAEYVVVKWVLLSDSRFKKYLGVAGGNQE
ncbi:MAG: hypothetical protein WC936_04690 [Candidatus Nanoarchaeia archaeon]|jgi:hypothetical protein